MKAKPKKILITGSNGYLGKNLFNYLKTTSDAYGIDIQDCQDNKKKFYKIDLTKKTELKKISKIKFDAIVHTAALSSLKACENDPQLAKKINVTATNNLLMFSQKNNSQLIFLSSDYVFDGKKGNYEEFNQTNPQTIYGKTKLEAEKIIKKYKNSTIIRTAQIFGRGGGNFFQFITQSLHKNQKIEVFNDVFFTPTYIDDLTWSIKKIIKNHIYGLFHIAGNSKETRYSFAKKIAQRFNLNSELLISSKAPKDELIASDSSLNNHLAEKIFGKKYLKVDEALKKQF